MGTLSHMSKSTARKTMVIGLLWLFSSGLPGCGEEGASNARRMIREKHAPRVAEIVLQDLHRHAEGLRKAAARLARGFVRVQGEQLEKDMRAALRYVRHPKKGIPELIITPLSFIAVVDKNGVVIARDTQPDRMKGMNLAERFVAVKRALAGKVGHGVGQFDAVKKGGKPSITVVMAAPSRYDGQVVGGIVLGIPLWRMAQRLSRQLQSEAADKGTVLWVYIYRGDELHHFGTPQSLDLAVPDAAARRQGLARSPGGFTGEILQFGSWYGFGVRPLRVLGKDIGVVVFRMDPKE